MIKALWPTAALLLLAGSALASPESGLNAVGKLAPVKKTEFYTLKYVDRLAKKRKTVKAYVKFDAAASFYVDTAAQLEAVAKGEKLWIYGEPLERNTQDENGRTQVDRQIVNTVAFAFGAGLEMPKADPKATGARWLARFRSPGGPVQREWGRIRHRIDLNCAAVGARYGWVPMGHHHASVPERPKGAACKAVQPRVQIPSGAQIFQHTLAILPP